VATLIRKGCNLLLMDEPTNHMDVQSMEAMEDALLAFEGAVLLVTHDRYLLGRVADCLLRIHDGRAEFREGGYEDNKAWIDLAPDAGETPAAKEPAPPEPKPDKPKPDRPKPYPAAPKGQAIDKEKQRRARRLEKQLAEAEAGISALEAGIAQLNEALARTDPGDWRAFQEKTQEIKKAEEDLMYAMRRWEGMQGETDGG
jgi:ATP-binding cassette subfamily F protein 3